MVGSNSATCQLHFLHPTLVSIWSSDDGPWRTGKLIWILIMCIMRCGFQFSFLSDAASYLTLSTLSSSSSQSLDFHLLWFRPLFRMCLCEKWVNMRTNHSLARPRIPHRVGLIKKTTGRESEVFSLKVLSLERLLLPESVKPEPKWRWDCPLPPLYMALRTEFLFVYGDKLLASVHYQKMKGENVCGAAMLLSIGWGIRFSERFCMTGLECEINGASGGCNQNAARRAYE